MKVTIILPFILEYFSSDRFYSLLCSLFRWIILILFYIGVITYLLLSGEPPFGGCGGPETLLQVRDNILNGNFRFEPKEIWQTVSQDAKDFIKRLLVTDPMERPTAQMAQEEKWLKKWSDCRYENGEDSSINPHVVQALVGFKEYSDMRKLLCEVLSFTLLPDQIQDLRKEFEKYDQEGTGEISLSTLKKVLIGNAATGSLGGLTESEVVDIFNAMRVRKGETSIRWHDFIAAGMSQCQVDDRNLRLAFGRLDQENKGYITFENVVVSIIRQQCNTQYPTIFTNINAEYHRWHCLRK
jgi:calcium-dependent protein kinase